MRGEVQTRPSPRAADVRAFALRRLARTPPATTPKRRRRRVFRPRDFSDGLGEKPDDHVEVTHRGGEVRGHVSLRVSRGDVRAAVREKSPRDARVVLFGGEV